MTATQQVAGAMRLVGRVVKLARRIIAEAEALGLDVRTRRRKRRTRRKAREVPATRKPKASKKRRPGPADVRGEEGEE